MKVDNSAWAIKQAMRQRVARELAPSARVLEAFAGEGRMFRAVWHTFRGVCMDLDAVKVEAAARERQRWACYHGDSLKALDAGWFAHVPFDVVDLGSYGEPWSFLRAWCESERERAQVTHLFLTDGYYARRSIGGCRALWGDSKARNHSSSAYVAQARTVMGQAFHAAGLRFAAEPTARLSPGGRMLYAHVAVEAG